MGVIHTPPPPALVQFDRQGKVNILPLGNSSAQSSPCPLTHFQCPPRGYCLPVFVRCNGVKDCPGQEDEARCRFFTCPGFYRCLNSKVCLHPDHVCDGVFHCLKRDDELFCDLRCPQWCTCYGSAFFCSQRFMTDRESSLRFLDVSGSRMSPRDVARYEMLVYLSLSACGLSFLHSLTLSNLRTLDVSHNYLSTISTQDLQGLAFLQHLVLADNPVMSLFNSNTSAVVHDSLLTLDLAHTPLQQNDLKFLSIFPNVRKLNFSLCGIGGIAGPALQAVPSLVEIDLRGCPMLSFQRGLFKDLDKLEQVFTDNTKLCCPALLPAHFNLLNCHAPFDEISSCKALLRSSVYRVCLSILATFALSGNAASFVFRVFSKIKKTKLAFGVFVTHLCVSDFLMGVYLAIIGVADLVYLGSYLWNDSHWRFSSACTFAGFLSMLSCEVSAFVACLITVDRFLVLRSPFGQIRFSKTTAHVAATAAWSVGVVIAAVPLLPAASHWGFYSQKGNDGDDGGDDDDDDDNDKAI